MHQGDMRGIPMQRKTVTREINFNGLRNCIVRRKERIHIVAQVFRSF